MKYILSLILLVGLVPSVNAANIRQIDSWAFTESNKLIFLGDNNRVLKEYEPLHCPIEELVTLLKTATPTPNLYIKGSRLRDITKVSFYTREEKITCDFQLT